MKVLNPTKYKFMKKLLNGMVLCPIFMVQGIHAQDVKKDWDTRWFIAPLTKFQVQDFGMLEKNRLGYMSDANTLSFRERTNISIAVSAYKNLTGRLSMSLDLGLANGHVTSPDVLISQTQSKTYNLVNFSVYYHLLSARYRLQPFMFAGFNGLVNDASYTSAPAGVGVKLNSRKWMLLAEAGYGFPVSKTIANTMIYSAGFYLALNNKKKKKVVDTVVNEPYNNWSKDPVKPKSDTAGKKANAGTIVNNFYITVKMDSMQNARKKAGGGEDPENQTRNGIKVNNSVPEMYDRVDSRVDTVNGKPVTKFVIYFYFNDYSLTSKAFETVDKIIARLKQERKLSVDIKGYTDDVGTVEFNNFLSRRRAKMVFDYMNSQGIPSERMGVQYFGKDFPVAPNDNPNTAWLNRRVEIILSER
jgi:outer membrane protein OmpA-like peptidoglycan-associated protein